MSQELTILVLVVAYTPVVGALVYGLVCGVRWALSHLRRGGADAQRPEE